jgi:hypothetical protein
VSHDGTYPAASYHVTRPAVPHERSGPEPRHEGTRPASEPKTRSLHSAEPQPVPGVGVRRHQASTCSRGPPASTRRPVYATRPLPKRSRSPHRSVMTSLLASEARSRAGSPICCADARLAAETPSPHRITASLGSPGAAGLSTNMHIRVSLSRLATHRQLPGISAVVSPTTPTDGSDADRHRPDRCPPTGPRADQPDRCPPTGAGADQALCRRRRASFRGHVLVSTTRGHEPRAGISPRRR